MGKSLFGKSVWAPALCALLLLTGPARPLAAYASIDDEYVDESYYDEEGVEEYDESVDDEDAFVMSNAPETPVSSAPLDALYAQRDKLEDNISDLKSKEKELQNNLNNAKTEKEKAIVARNNLAYEITVRTNLIAALEEKIMLLEDEIGFRQQNIEDKQAEIDYNYDLLKKRLKAMYMQDDGTLLGLLLGSDSFSEFLTRSEYMVRIAEHDRNLMRQLTDQRVAIEEEKASLEKAKAQEEADKAEVEEEKQALGVKHYEAAQQVQDIDRMEQEYLADLARNKALQEAAKAELNKVFQQIEWSKNPYVGGAMLWPLPGYQTISSSYGSRFGGNDFHTGMDITGSGCFGATIVAANDGIVKFVNTTYSNGVGYGIYLIIDHGVDENGNQLATLYAHCSAITVGLGQNVKKGDPIAQVGSTGWSTGPHLHFEVRVNNNAVEPSQYLKG